MSGLTSAPIDGLGAKLIAALLVTVGCHLGEQAHLLLAIFLLPYLPASRPVAGSVLIPLILNVLVIPVRLHLKDGTFLYKAPNAFALNAKFITATMPGYLHEDAGAYDRLGNGRRR